MINRFFPPLLLSVNGILYVGVGWLFITAPEQWFAAVGVSLRDSMGMTELRSVYGGFMLAFGLFLLICGLRREHLRTGLLLMLLTYTGLVAARSWGVLVLQDYNTLVLQIYISEWLALLLSVAAWFVLRRSS